MMHDPDIRISRRTALKGAAASGVGVVVGGAIAGQSSPQAGAPPEAIMGSNEEWFAQRAWSVSANKVLPQRMGPPAARHHPGQADRVSNVCRGDRRHREVASGDHPDCLRVRRTRVVGGGARRGPRRGDPRPRSPQVDRISSRPTTRPWSPWDPGWSFANSSRR